MIGFIVGAVIGGTLGFAACVLVVVCDDRRDR